MIDVCVIEDHPVFRHGLAMFVENATTLRLVGSFPSVETFDQAGTEPPHVIVLDLHLPGLQGGPAVEHVTGPETRVLIVSAATQRDDVLEAIGAGACGYLGKDSGPDEIVKAIEVVAAGGTYVSPTLASFILDANRRDPERDALKLTPKEHEVLTLLARGERDVDIAEHLYISVSTVRSHLDRIRDKTGKRRRADLTRLAYERGLVDPDASETRER
jgi:DNA-binding NarL/FixJ family response regulator